MIKLQIKYENEAEKAKMIEILSNTSAEKCYTGERTYWGWKHGNTYPRKNSRRTIAQTFGIS